MKLFKTILGIIFFMFLMSVFMLNKHVEMPVNYFGLSKPLKVQFWELVTVCVALGVFISALWDFFSELKWRRQRRKMIQTHNEHVSVEAGLKARIEELEAEKLRRESDQAPRPSGMPAGPPKEPAIASRPMLDKSAVTTIRGKTDTPVEKAATKDETTPPRTGFGRTTDSKEQKDTPAQPEPPKKTGFLSRFRGRGSQTTPSTAATALTTPPEQAGKPSTVGPQAVKPPEEKQPGLVSRFGKTSSTDTSAGTAASEQSAQTTPVPATKTDQSIGEPSPGADPKVLKPPEKESADQAKRDS